MADKKTPTVIVANIKALPDDRVSTMPVADDSQQVRTFAEPTLKSTQAAFNPGLGTKSPILLTPNALAGVNQFEPIMPNGVPVIPEELRKSKMPSLLAIAGVGLALYWFLKRKGKRK